MNDAWSTVAGWLGARSPLGEKAAPPNFELGRPCTFRVSHRQLPEIIQKYVSARKVVLCQAGRNLDIALDALPTLR
jgi:hypothetical protein